MRRLALVLLLLAARPALAQTVQGIPALSAAAAAAGADLLPTSQSGSSPSTKQTLTAIQTLYSTVPCTAIALTDASSTTVNAGSTCNSFTLLMTSGVGSTRALANPTGTTVNEILNFAITQPSAGGPYALTFGGDYFDPAGNALVVNLNQGASAVTTFTCQVTTSTPTVVCFGAKNSTTGTKSVAAPSAPASTGAYQAQGLSSGTTVFTPNTTGTVQITVSGYCTTSSTTATIGAQFYIMHGTGNGNSNGSTTLGTQDGSAEACEPGTTLTAAGDWHSPWSKTWVVTGLIVGTAYYVDLAGEAIGTASDVKLNNVDIAVVEIR